VRRLYIHSDAKADLAAIAEHDLPTAARIYAVLEQVQANPALMDSLTQHDYGFAGTADFNVSLWKSQQYKNNRNLWRLKIWDLEEKQIRYRVVYAFQPETQKLFVLGVSRRRDFDYEYDEFTQRVTDCYDRHLAGR
jgi:hypothetical protein